jgi:beta-fructofuranosidase
MPRVLRVRPDGRLSQQPPAEFTKLRGDHYQEWNVRLNEVSHVVEDVRGQGDTIEIMAEIDPGDASVYGLKIRRSPDGKRSVLVSYDGRTLVVGDKQAEVDLMDGVDTLNLRVFIDKELVEVFANDWVVFSNHVSAPSTDMGVEVFAEGGEAHLKSLDIWQLKTIW